MPNIYEILAMDITLIIHQSRGNTHILLEMHNIIPVFKQCLLIIENISDKRIYSSLICFTSIVTYFSPVILFEKYLLEIANASY